MSGPRIADVPDIARAFDRLEIQPAGSALSRRQFRHITGSARSMLARLFARPLARSDC
jgi:hypothetical protein